ncbi:Carbon catabolite-derepressing protein kinase [Camellia lanceoleosa]|nr:Carbon catabolite-derepressing protein kinase [Camellia lanceoleosa]
MVISGKLYAGPKVDVWSCGVMLFLISTNSSKHPDTQICADFGGHMLQLEFIKWACSFKPQQPYKCQGAVLVEQ